MLNILNHSPSAINHFLYEMRHKDIQKDRAKFRNNLKRLGMIMAYEISREFTYSAKTITTPLAEHEVQLMDDKPVLIGVLRAATPFLDGFIDVFDDSDVGFIGAYRVQEGEEVGATLEYKATNSLEGKVVILVDPMLATGKSVLTSVNTLIMSGKPSHVHIAAAVAAPEGVNYISENLKVKHTIWTAALDEKLNEKSYIVPGLGDAGDLCFGPKL
ncbi:uracil phosphoribosyltransferase [Fulvivirga sediminis]|uniref:Uracil phosphoribosyltransferase n=1 Tax=Fulvivirga sediminis TaxID=2803949 RepID=A0A937F9X2_9BACT|nr:uracil phosphoribosyltransferase [Fulvivirga sediminis]MBL3656985.1 uracil phosphoribosyltransferase [Fulvivirga sediminis]